MEHYELKLFGPRKDSAPLRPTLGRFAFSAQNDLAAIEHARDVFAAAISESDYARLHHGDGMIWEEYDSDG